MTKPNHCCSECERGNPCDASFRITSQNSCEVLRSVPNLPLSPTSGLFINASGQLDIDCSILGTLCTWPITTGVPQVTNYTWTVAPNRIIKGGQITINAAGLAPHGIITFQLTPDTGPESFISGKADASGNLVNLKVRLEIAGATYTVTPVYPGGVPNISSYQVEVMECGEQVECTCAGSVTLKPVLSNYSVVSGQAVTLLILATNTNTCAISDLDLPALSLPPSVSSSGVSITSSIVAGKSTRTFEYQLQVQNTSGSTETVNIVIPAGVATFKCAGIEYSAGGGSVALTIAPATGSFCGIAVTEFKFTPGLVDDEVTSNLSITIKNNGSLAVTDLTMPQLNIGGTDVQITAGASSIGFAAVPTLAPGATHTVTVAVTYKSLLPLPHTHAVVVPSGHIYATCNGSLISTGVSSTAIITLTEP